MGKDLNGKSLGKGFSQKKNGVYEARTTVNGVKISCSHKNLTTLKEIFEEEKLKVITRTVTYNCSYTVSSWFKLWFEKYKQPTLKPTSVDIYRRNFVNTFGRLLGDFNLSELKQADIQTAISDLKNEGYALKSIRDRVSILRLCLDAAVANNLIPTNPCIGTIVPTYNEIKPERRVLTEREEKIILDAVKGTFYEPLYKIMLLTGMRIGEIGGLQWEDIDFENKIIHVRRNLSCQYIDGEKKLSLVHPKTKYSLRKIPFFDETEQVLMIQRKQQDELKKSLGKRWRCEEEFGDLVFTSSMGSPLTRYTISTAMRDLEKDINGTEIAKAFYEKREPELLEHIHPHCFRHTFATRLCRKGMPIQVVQRIMGHANINMTMEYTHILEEQLKEEASNVGELLSC